LTDIREIIPETFPKQPFPPRLPFASHARHMAILYRDVIEGRFRTLDLPPCEWLRIESPYPVQITADGERIMENVDQGPIPKTVSGTGPESWEFQADPGADGIQFAVFRPACSFTLNRQVERLSFAIPFGGAAGDWATFSQGLVGTIHIWIGAGKIRDVSWGLPQNFALVTESNPVAAIFGVEPIRPTIAGDNALSPSGFRWVPSRAILTGLGMSIDWTAAAGNFIAATLFLIGGGARPTWHVISKWYAQEPILAVTAAISVVDFEFSPVEICPWQHRKAEPLVGNIGALSLYLEFSAAVDTITTVLRGQAWF
jgi:hypothetical protein